MARFHLYEISKIVKFIDSKGGIVVVTDRGEEHGELLINKHKVSVKQDE